VIRRTGRLLSIFAAIALLAGRPARAQIEPAGTRPVATADGAAPAETALALSRRGSALLEEGQPLAAADALQRALDTDDGSLDLAGARAATRYNLALARVRAGDLPAATEMLQGLEAADVDPSLRARARFNRGHALFTEAETMAEADPPAAVERYLRAAEAFRLAAAMGGNDAARAARNVEISRLAARRLRDRLQGEQERRQQAEQMAEQLQDLAERQQQLSDESQQRAQQPEQSTEDLQQQQDGLRQQAQELLEQMREMAEQSRTDQRRAEQTPEEGAADDIEQATRAQDEASRDLRAQRTEGAAEDQQRAADLLRQAAERLATGQSDQQDGQQGQQQEAQEDQSQQAHQGEQEGEGEQRDAIAEYLLDKERAEREAREHIRGRLGRIVPVEKDW
jgi:hypothetical protein